MTIQLSLPAQFENFCIRDWTSSDAEALADIEYDVEIKKYFELPVLPKKQFISEFNPELIRGWAIEYKPSNALAGTIDFSSYCDSGNKKEIRIFLSADYQEKGIGKTAVKYSVERILEAGWVQSVIGVVHPNNEAGQALMKALDFTLVGKSKDGINEVYEINKT